MDDQILLGLWRCTFPIPRPLWQSQVKGDADRLDFMSEEHHYVRNFVVRELPRIARPMTPVYIAQGLNLDIHRVVDILVELEENMTFLFRNPDGAVTWAYPVTVARTPHQVTFSSGEVINAA